MPAKPIGYRIAFAAAALAATLALAPSSGHAAAVAEGFDLFETQPGTTFMGVPFEGVPLGSFDFGGAVGVKPTAQTDTIVQRLAVADSPIETIPIELVALQLVSAVPVDFGLGVGNYYITLQSARGGPDSTGQMTIDFGTNLFDSAIDVFFDIRLGALDGPIALSDMVNLVSDDVAWDRTPLPGQLLINGANHLLNGIDHDLDFFPLGPFEESKPGVGVHVVDAASIPEPATLAAFGLGLIGLAALRRRRAA